MKSIKDYSDYTIIHEYERRFVAEKIAVKRAFTSAEQARKLLLNTDESDREHFGILFLDGQNQLIKSEILFSGSITTSAVYPREVIKKILEYKAANIVLCHNHPSGALVPSSSDRTLTKKLQTACQAIDVEILDHIIIGGTKYYSFADSGIL